MSKEIMGVMILLTLKLRKALVGLCGWCVNKGWLPSSQYMGIVLIINNKANWGIHKPIRCVD